ncbi:MAG: hypothetical protein ACI9LM_004981 [Alteromonadaceae bacterium]|jgi:hypothetical protein|tara:strand:- start:400 stop:591 length:192 start_codon:yes stop_codon:yes gene_type:complete
MIFLIISLIFFADKTYATPQLENNYKSPLAFTTEVNNYLQKDKLEPVEKNGIVITGSSSVRFW